MPIYEYRCNKCGRISEFLESSGKPADKKCGHCGSERLKKQLSTFAAGVGKGTSKRCFGCSDDTCLHSQR